MANEPEQGPGGWGPRAILARLRFSMADGAMLVVAASAASALFARTVEAMDGSSQRSLPPFKYDVAVLLVLAVGFTAVGLGAYKRHSVSQVLLQVTLACLALLSAIELGEAGWNRALLYWFQASFALMVAGPAVARRVVKASLPRGPRRSWWKNTLEAVAFSWFNVMLVLLGMLIQWTVYAIVGEIL
ncbi:hypothetical protein [Tautonia plasticadhaerens]|uniref:Uncharacterized protein n=1 Tax=Tautonia plasticadhaerens TaxID=2527974 RepID=A0A518H2X4_9BACT|nr:hypothetical protein [Tautonia plasticadhaerens]QDV35186.1 hypothetical protein ElP_30890 [Tautonia plasticadhaerens]